MTQAAMTEPRVARYEIEVMVKAPLQRVWEALIREPNEWWPNDFHCAGPDSVVMIDPTPGGMFREVSKSGGLLWGTVIAVEAPKKITFQGSLAPDWGGPATSIITFALEEQGNNTVVKISDSLIGLITEGTMQSLEGGWKKLIGEGLKKHVEK